MSRSDVLVDADWVEAHLDDPKVVLVEVDEDTSAYDKNHIRGAVRIDWKKDLQDPVRRDFVDKARLREAAVRARASRNDDTVVLYGGNNNWFAAYAYWYFKLYGHQDVKLLDGGRKKWELDSRELVPDVPRAAGDPVHGQGAGHRRSAPSGTRSVAAIGTQEPGRRALARRVHRQAARPGAPAAGAVAASRPHPDRAQHPVVEGRQRRRHLQVATTSSSALRRGRRRLRQGHHRLLPHRRALGAHLVRAARAARTSRTSRTTTARGPSTAPSSACRSSWGAATDVRSDRPAACRRRESTWPGRRSSRAGDPRRRAGRRVTCGCWTAPASSPPRCRPRRPDSSASSPRAGTWTVRALVPGASRSTARWSRQQGAIAEVEVSLPT